MKASWSQLCFWCNVRHLQVSPIRCFFFPCEVVGKNPPCWSPRVTFRVGGGTCGFPNDRAALKTQKTPSLTCQGGDHPKVEFPWPFLGLLHSFKKLKISPFATKQLGCHTWRFQGWIFDGCRAGSQLRLFPRAKQLSGDAFAPTQRP